VKLGAAIVTTTVADGVICEDSKVGVTCYADISFTNGRDTPNSAVVIEFVSNQLKREE
jgi:hypothetical protein